ncbi:FACT complex subunit SSRP1 [Nesidiocoris tenuis]|uniref:Odorant receptor n=1 Tax=Nesidiocoris tenuis TaxID=355587 RepID=A0ABN7A8P0_9HEMI|nr:FACT complex subunit SSRP1 [Nesidiocoris tenuis]
MIPFVLKRQEAVDPDVQRGYDLMYAKLMRAAGIYPDLVGKKYTWYGVYSSYVHVGYVFYVTVYAISAYYAAIFASYEILATNACLGTVTFMYSMVAHNFMFRRWKIDRMFKMIGNGFYHYDRPLTPKELDILDKSASACALSYRRNIFWGFMLAVTCSLVPLLMPGIRGDYGTINPGDAPVNPKLNIPMYFPWDTTKPVAFWLTNAMIGHGASTECAIVASTCCLYTNFCITLASQIDLLALSINDIKARAVKRYEKEHQLVGEPVDDKKFNKCMNYCLNENIEHLQVLKEFHRTLQNVVAPAVFTIFSGTALTISTPLFQLISVLMKDEIIIDDAVDAITYTYYIICFLALLYYYCVYGQLVIDKSETIYFAFYDAPWIGTDLEFRQKIIISLANAKKPMTLSAFGLVTASSITLLDIVKTIFSYLNLLLATGSQD